MSLPQRVADNSHQRPLRVAIANDYPLVIAGTARALEQHTEQVTVVEYDSGTHVKSEVDMVLFDYFGHAQGTAVIRTALQDKASTRVVAFSWNTDPERVAAFLVAGAAGVVSKTVSAEELVNARQRVHRGEQVTPTVILDSGEGDGHSFGRWPGAEFGVSAREAEVLALICQGLSNKVVGQSIFLGANTIKSHIRSLYRKIGVETRSQAVIWGMSNGFKPDKVRGYPQ